MRAPSGRPARETAPPSYASTVLAGGLSFLVLTALAIGFAFVSLEVGFVVVLVIGLVVMVVQVARAGGEMFAPSLLAILAAVPSLYLAERWVDLSGGTLARDISVAEAPGRRDASRFAFTDARIVADHAVSIIVSYTDRSAGTTTRTKYYGVAPLVGPGWKPGDPVPAWIGCHADSWVFCTQSFRRPIRELVRAGSNERGAYARVVASAVRSRRLSAVPGAPILVPALSGDGGLTFYWAGALILPAGVWLGWALALLVLRRWRGRGAASA